METALLVLGALAGIAVLLIVGTLWRGYVLHLLWGWFMVPIFGLPALSVAAAIGVSLVVTFLTYQFFYAEDDRSNSTKIGSAIGTTVLYPLMVLGIGYVVKSFI